MGNPIVQDEPPSPRGDDAVYVQLRGREGGDLYYKIRRQMPLGVLQEAYLSREKLDGVGVLFLYGGRSVHPSETPEELGMEPLVTLDVCQI